MYDPVEKRWVNKKVDFLRLLVMLDHKLISGYIAGRLGHASSSSGRAATASTDSISHHGFARQLWLCLHAGLGHTARAIDTSRFDCLSTSPSASASSAPLRRSHAYSASSRWRYTSSTPRAGVRTIDSLVEGRRATPAQTASGWRCCRQQEEHSLEIR